jgi:UTP--glucose-1-phosphate uridylyltransferase
VTGEDKLRREGLPEEAVAAFRQLYDQLAAGSSGTLPDAELTPVRGLPTLKELPRPAALPSLEHACVLKLNGGLGTSMGLERAKSLLEARDGLSFLDIIARQVRALRAEYHVRMPLVLMHSFRTQADSLAALAGLDDVVDFLQHKVPKLRADSLEPVEWPKDPSLEWCPPGHGDLYAALRASGTLDALLADGIRYAFVSNADNLGAVLDPVILEWFAASGAPFAMETVIGTEADRKGGHIAWRDGHLVLRETAQAAPEEAESFRDFQRWRYYNTNNLWLDLEALAALDGPPNLPLIVNRKTVDPRDPDSTPVIQTETAMGAAIGVKPSACRARGSCPSRPRTTCSRCARTSTGCCATAASTRSPSRPTSRSTRAISRRSATSRRASRTVRPRSPPAGASSSAATSRSARASSPAGASRSAPTFRTTRC